MSSTISLQSIANGLGETVAETATEEAAQFLSDPTLLAVGIVLIIAAVLVIFFLKRIIINSILGLIAWGLLYYVLGIKLPFAASLAVSIIFGLAGIGVMLVLAFFGII